MLKFSKCYNTNNNVNTKEYNKLGRITPEEIIMKKYEYNNSLNKKEEPKKCEQEIKQVNNGANLYNKLNAFKHDK